MKIINIVVLFLCMSSVYAGQLDPPAAPGAGGTMKTLEEVEPRTVLSQENTPGNTSYVFTITEPGSYYLTGNIDTDKNGGISISAVDVILDLCGYRINGIDGTLEGIRISRNNVEVRNGSISNFKYGVYSTSSCNETQVLNIRAISNVASGIYLYGSRNFVKNCLAKDNGDSYAAAVFGIRAGGGSLIEGNRSYSNGTSAAGEVYGIYAGGSCQVLNNFASANGGSADDDVWGIYAYDSSVLKGNTAASNGQYATGQYVRGIHGQRACQIEGNTATSNGYRAEVYYVFGIQGSLACVIKGNTAYNNGGNVTGSVEAIYCGAGSSVVGNSVSFNGSDATGTVYGIYLVSQCFVDQNNAYENDGTNLIIRSNCTYGTNHAP